ncbi:hypothetical protein L1D54_12650 [Vibrio brasiliensis]|uniref:hypothetical protein n=1 Tax=Vibrio brasiliensis TaxID=170652 RepID=UPI001EFDFCB4|nr:hypothetical protein [Vibrio brasiliensis]MCG9751335.1 hypothetical protein [Vibrio brasiliensis]
MGTTADKSIDWLVDSPLFIDDKQLNNLYEAIVKPEFELVSISSKQQDTSKNKVSDKTVIGGDVSSSFLNVVKAKLSIRQHNTDETEQGTSQEFLNNFQPIQSAERKLEELAALYNFVDKYELIYDKFDVSRDTPPEWYTKFSKRVPNPKPLCFFDLPPGVCLIPAAAEFSNGKVVQLFSEYREALTNENGGPSKHYPEPDEQLGGDELVEKRKEYWDSYTTRFSATKAMVCIEKACEENGDIRWIAFRVPVTTTGDTLHLHIMPNEKYYTGTFAYNFVKRFYKHGGKLVGMLKSEPDLNVLAIYEN